MVKIKLDFRKLFGFKIIATELERRPQHAPVSAKIGVKVGEKAGIKTRPALRN